MGRCPRGCAQSLSIPFDGALGIAPHQSSSEELIPLGCLLSVVLPYDLASSLLGQWRGLSVSASTLWNWVQTKGQQAQAELAAQLPAQAVGADCAVEGLDPALSALPLAIAADGVIMPFRPQVHKPQGKTRWHEVKVGILARLGVRTSRTGERLPQLLHRRVVAVLGDIDAFIPRLQLAARRQAFERAPQVIWLSDGGRGFWRVYHTCFAHCAIPVGDFFHAAGHLWRATQALFDDPRSAQALAWFARWRHQLRHGHHQYLLTTLTTLVNTDWFSGKSLTTLLQVSTRAKLIRYCES